MSRFFRKAVQNAVLYAAFASFCAGCAAELSAPIASSPSTRLNFGPEQELGAAEKNPAAPFLRFARDGRLFAVWTEDHEHPWPHGKHTAGHQHAMRGDRAPSPMRNALIASSIDGKSWSPPKRVNSSIEAVQGEENGPKIAFDPADRVHVVWSIPGGRGDKTRANVRFARDDGTGGFTPARTLNEVTNAARFPIIEAMPDGTFLIAWIDRRLDNPNPRQLYLMKTGPEGQELTKNYQAGAGLCECCKLGIAFGDGGRTVYLVSREVTADKTRNHVLRKSTDGAATFALAVEISNDGWQVPSCPHSGPSIGRDSLGRLHVVWFTLGRSEREAGIYYSVSMDGGASFAPRRLVHANTAPEILYNNLAVGEDDSVYLAWTNLDEDGRAQVFMRAIGADGTWSAIHQVSRARGNASRPVLASREDLLYVAWTETEGEDSRAVLRTARLGR
jgi:hypothetical protein